MTKYHVLMGKRVPVDKYDTDHLMRLMIHISKRCRKFALKHNNSMKWDDGGVWVARGFVRGTSVGNSGNQYELATTGESPLVAAEKFSTMLDDFYEKDSNPHQPKTQQSPERKK